MEVLPQQGQGQVERCCEAPTGRTQQGQHDSEEEETWERMARLRLAEGTQAQKLSQARSSDCESWVPSTELRGVALWLGTPRGLSTHATPEARFVPEARILAWLRPRLSPWQPGREAGVGVAFQTQLPPLTERPEQRHLPAVGSQGSSVPNLLGTSGHFGRKASLRASWAHSL